MSSDRSALLQQLKLDKETTSPSNQPALKTVLLVLLALLIGTGLGIWLAGARSELGESQNSAIAQAPASTRSESSLSKEPLKTAQKVLDASGYVTARQVATVSAEVMGLILTVDVEEGMFVERGQVVATIDDTVAQIQLRLANTQVETQLARLDSLQVELDEARRELKRIENLGSAGDYASEAQLTRAQTAVERLKASMRSAKADLSMARLQVERQQDLVNDHRITAPFSGVVTAKNAQAGEIVSPSSAGGGFTRTGICTLVDMDSLEVEVDVNEAFIGRVAANQEVVALLDAYPDWPIAAQVAAVIPTADRAKATVRVRIELLQKDPRILPDMGVKVSFLAEEG